MGDTSKLIQFPFLNGIFHYFYGSHLYQTCLTKQWNKHCQLATQYYIIHSLYFLYGNIENNCISFL